MHAHATTLCGAQVLLVALDQSLEKYKYTMRKLGLPLQQHLDSGSLAVLGAADLGLAGPSCCPGDGSALR